MDDLPAPYDSLPDGMKEVILTTYMEDTRENDNFSSDLGFSTAKEKIELSLEQLLDRMRDSGRLRVLEDIYARCTILPSLWGCIRTITAIWTYPQGLEISQGSISRAPMPIDSRTSWKPRPAARSSLRGCRTAG